MDNTMDNTMVNINMLSKFDRTYLEKHGYFSELDEDGDERHELEEDDEPTSFDSVITGITHEILRALFKIGITNAIPSYTVNKFVIVFKEVPDLPQITRQIIQAFIKGSEYDARLDNDETEEIFKVIHEAEEGESPDTSKTLTREQFLQAIMVEFTHAEQVLINPRIYLNEGHTDYYIKYHSEEYNYCFDYLKENRDLLK